MSPRWIKLTRDADLMFGRLVLMGVALAIGTFAVTLMGGAYQILTREIAANYLATKPADAHIHITASPENAAGDAAAALRALPGIAEAEITDIIEARTRRADGTSVPLTLFVAPPDKARLNLVFANQAPAPAPKDGSAALERTAADFLGLQPGGQLEILLPGQAPLQVPVSGLVHDPGLAPAWQEQSGYAYVSLASMRQWLPGYQPDLVRLRMTERDGADQAQRQKVIDEGVAKAALALTAQGYILGDIRIPPVDRHPHQGQMTAVITMFLVFTGVALFLSALLAATMIDSLLAREIRQIAIMKTLGATGGEIFTLYLTAVGVIAGLAALTGLAAGIPAARFFSQVIADLLNFDVRSDAIGIGTLMAIGFAGLALPLLAALPPVRRAAQVTIHQALSDMSLTRGDSGLARMLTRISPPGATAMMLAIRNGVRRRGRLLMSAALLGSAGALFLAANSVELGWRTMVNRSAAERLGQVEMRFDGFVATRQVADALANVPGLTGFVPSPVLRAARARPDGLAIMRTYPDGGHANLDLRGLAQMDELARMELLQGALPGTDARAAVLSESAWRLAGRPVIGEEFKLLTGGALITLKAAAVVREIMAPATIYMPLSGFSAAARQDGTNAVRLDAPGADAAGILALQRAATQALEAREISISRAITSALMNDAVGGHVKIMIVSLQALAALMALTGLIGLSAALGASVIERTGEFAVMRTLGAEGGTIARIILAEGLATGAISLIPAFAAAPFLSLAIGSLVGGMSFGIPLPVILPAAAVGMWILMIGIGTVIAGLAPARAGQKLTVREALARI